MIIFHCTCRQELLQAREKQKEEQVIALKRSMESGMVSFYRTAFIAIWPLVILLMAMTLSLTLLCNNLQAQAMKEQAQLREEMAYQYKLGNFEVRITK